MAASTVEQIAGKGELEFGSNDILEEGQFKASLSRHLKGKRHEVIQ